MGKRMLIMLAAMLLVVVALGFLKFTQIRTAMAQGAAWRPPPEAVTTIVAREEEWSARLSAIGTVAAVHGVTVSAELPNAYMGYSLGSCQGSAMSTELEMGEFHFGYKYHQFGAEVTGAVAGP